MPYGTLRIIVISQVSGREVFEFNPTLIMEDDEDTEGEVFVHHHNMVRGGAAQWVGPSQLQCIHCCCLLGYYSN